MTFLWCGRSNIGPNEENSLHTGSLSHSLVLDRLESLMISGSASFSVFNQEKIGVKIQHQMEVLNPICMAPNMTVLTKITIWILILHCLTKRNGVNRTFPLAKQDINRGSRYEPENN